jgi:[acyl-carrier-protein] S-malonyltransferase
MAFNSQVAAFLFPGQGSQEVGMGKELAARYPAAARVFEEADEIVGFALSRLCWAGPAEELNDTVNTQPALLCHSVAALRSLQSVRPDLQASWLAGHSLGEFSALVAAGAMQFPDALRLVRTRGEAMKAAGARGPGGMAAVLGLELETVEAACAAARAATGEPVQIANDNCPGQLVISGSQLGMASAIERLRAGGARRVVELAVSIAAHSALMEPAQSKLNRAIESTPISAPTIPVIGNVSATSLASVSEVREELRSQLTSRVRWTETIGSMLAAGVTHFIELGPRDVLSNLVKRIERGANAATAGDPAGIERLGGGRP